MGQRFQTVGTESHPLLCLRASWLASKVFALSYSYRTKRLLAAGRVVELGCPAKVRDV